MLPHPCFMWSQLLCGGSFCMVFSLAPLRWVLGKHLLTGCTAVSACILLMMVFQDSVTGLLIYFTTSLKIQFSQNNRFRVHFIPARCTCWQSPWEHTFSVRCASLLFCLYFSLAILEMLCPYSHICFEAS
jgi:hypothetical protein